MRTADRFSVPRGAMRYWVAEGGGGGGAYRLVMTVSMMTVHTRHYVTHNDGEIINVCILK